MLSPAPESDGGKMVYKKLPMYQLKEGICKGCPYAKKDFVEGCLKIMNPKECKFLEECEKRGKEIDTMMNKHYG